MYRREDYCMNTIGLYENQNNFIMLPKVDFCFKEMMQNEKVRQGLISALLDVLPEEISKTTLLPTVLRKEFKEDKYGIPWWKQQGGIKSYE